MRKIRVVFAFLVLFSATAEASVIQLTTRLATEGVIEGGLSRANVSIVNTGDEPAYNVVLSLVLPPGFESRQLAPGVLNPNEPFNGAFDIKVDEGTLPGLYPVVLLTNYADANSYPFSTVSAKTTAYRQAAPIKVFGVLSDAELSGGESGVMTLRLRNMDEKPHTVRVKFYAPQEIKVEGGTESVALPAKGEGSAEFRVSNFGALGGSTYAVFATVTYEDNGIAHASIAGNVVRIPGGAGSQAKPTQGGGKNDGGGSNLVLYALTISLIALTAVGVYYGRKKK